MKIDLKEDLSKMKVQVAFFGQFLYTGASLKNNTLYILKAFFKVNLAMLFAQSDIGVVVLLEQQASAVFQLNKIK